MRHNMPPQAGLHKISHDPALGAGDLIHIGEVLPGNVGGVDADIDAGARLLAAQEGKDAADRLGGFTAFADADPDIRRD